MKSNRFDLFPARPWLRFLVPLVVMCGSAMYAQAPELTVKNAWARPPLVPQNNSAVYMTLENSSATPRTIVAVSSSDATAAELHSMSMEGTMMRMAPVKEVGVAAKSTLELKPGGFHIMLFGVKKKVIPGDHINLVLTLDDGKSIPVTATVRSADEEPGAAAGGKERRMPEMK
jgi:copper(I)-binding protein